MSGASSSERPGPVAGTIGDLARLTRTGAEAPPATVFSEKVTQVKQQTKERQKGDE